MAQDIEVKSFKQVEASADASARKDINGVICGLVRVQLKEKGAQFEGNIIGDVTFRNGEYWVYMPKGSKRIGIKHPEYLPITIVFENYNIKRLESGAEYVMSTKLHKEKEQKKTNKMGSAVFQITPSIATLAIDGEMVNHVTGGQYSLTLPYGTHYYSVQYGSFSISNQAVKIDKQPKVVNVDLTEYFAKLSVKCLDKDASIYINDEFEGVGTYEELVVPGSYSILAQREGYYPLSQTIILEDNEETNVNFGEMKSMTGGLKVDYEPIGAEVYLDGEKIGVTPLTLDKVTTGNHTLKIQKEYCEPITRNIIVSEGKELEIKGSLPMTFWAVLLNEAAKGDQCAMCLLGYYYSYVINIDKHWDLRLPCGLCYEKYVKMATDESYEGHISFSEEENDIIVSINQGIKWLKKALSEGKATHKINNGPYIMTSISTCYAYLKHYDESFKWAKKCVETYNRGYTCLAWHYCYGRGVEKNVSLAKKYNEFIDNWEKNTLTNPWRELWVSPQSQEQ